MRKRLLPLKAVYNKRRTNTAIPPVKSESSSMADERQRARSVRKLTLTNDSESVAAKLTAVWGSDHNGRARLVLYQL